MRVLSAHTKPISSLAFSPDGTRLAEAAHDGIVRVWDLAAGAVVHTFAAPGKFPRQVRLAFAPDGATLAVANDRVELVEPATGTRTPLPGRPVQGPYNGVCFSPDGRYAAAAGCQFGWWDVAARQSLVRPYFRRATAESMDSWSCVAFSPDGTRLAVGRTAHVYRVVGTVNTVFVYDIPGEKVVGSFEWGRQEPRAVLFAADGRTVVSAAGPVLRAWDLDAGAQVAEVKVGVKHFMGVARSPDGRHVATVSKDRTARLWDTRTWGEPRTFDWEIGELLAVAFAPDGGTAAVASHKGNVLLFDVD